MNEAPNSKKLVGKAVETPSSVPSSMVQPKAADITTGSERETAAKTVKKPFRGLSTKLLLLTIAFVMLSEVFVFVPSVAKFRNDWLKDRLARAQTVIILSQDMPETAEDNSAVERALATIDVVTLAERREGRKRLIATIEGAPPVSAQFDVIETGPLKSVGDAFGTLLAQEPRTILVTGNPPGGDVYIEAVVSETPLRQAMLIYTRNVLALSLIISGLTAAMVYFALSLLFVRPIKNMADNMVAFSKDPEAVDRVIKPTGRNDELGVAEEKLAAMQYDLQGTLSGQKHLATLGLAVSKINHDLRNILASVQLFSDRISDLPDPDVQRFAPKLIAGIDRAINYCQSTLVYGSAREEAPKRQIVQLRNVVEEIAALLDLDDATHIEWRNAVPQDFELDADPEQIFRVLMNLSRNAVKVLERLEGDTVVRRLEISAVCEGEQAVIHVADTGPGVPAVAKRHLFEAFKGSFSKGGTGLGLAIADEIVRAHGGTIRLLEQERPGATFEIVIPNSSFC